VALVVLLALGLSGVGIALSLSVAFSALPMQLLVPLLSLVPARYHDVDAATDTDAREFLDTTLAALEPNPVIISWWSYSTPLWYGRWVEGARPDMTIIDDRTMLDEHLGSPGCDDRGGSQCMIDVIDGYLDERPVYLIRLDDDLPEFRTRFLLEKVPGILHGTVWHVVGRQPNDGG